MKKLIILALVLLVLAGAGYFYYSKGAGKKGGEYVTAAVRRGDIVSSVSATGKLQPRQMVLVGTEVSGTIRQIYVDYNSQVKKGQALLKLDQEVFRTQVEQAQANLTNSIARLAEMQAGRDMQRSDVKTSLDQKKAALDKASADYEREKALFDKGMVSKSDLDAMEMTYKVAKSQLEQANADSGRFGVIDAQIDQAKASVRQAKAALAMAETNLGKTVIKSPIDGVVVNKNVEVGQTVAASFATPDLLDIGDLGEMEVDASIDEADVGQTSVGQKVEFTVDAFPTRVFTGTLAKIYYSPVTVQNVVTYTGVIYAPNPERLLRPGMTANIKIITSEKKDVLLVPNAALRIKMDTGTEKPKGGGSGGRGGGRTVWVMKGKKPEPVQVKTGVTDFTSTEVLSGISEGDSVLVEAPSKGDSKNGGSGGGQQGGHGGRPGGMMRM